MACALLCSIPCESGGAPRPSEGSGVERRKQSELFDQGASSCRRLGSSELSLTCHRLTASEGRAENGTSDFCCPERRWLMSNRVRYYITESDNRPIVRSVPVTVSTQPANDLMVFEKKNDIAEKDRMST